MNDLTAPLTSTPVTSNTGLAYETLRQGVDLYMGRTLRDDCSETLEQTRLDQSDQTTRVDVLETTLASFTTCWQTLRCVPALGPPS